MKIQVKENTSNLTDDNWFKKIIDSLNNLDNEHYVKDLITFNQSEQKEKVQDLQHFIVKHLEKNHSNFEWQMEYKVSENRDAIDIFGEKGQQILIIELDKWRADQVAKKLISRTALMIDRKVGFISLCYAGTERMNKNECLKYFRYGNIVSTELNNYFAGMIIE